MAFRLVSSNGDVSDSSAINLPGSGVINANTAVDFIRGSGGNVVAPSSNASTTTMVFGVSLDYIQGASDAYVKVIPFLPEQLWEVDCANATVTAQVGLRHIFSASRGYIHNTSSDVTGQTGVFLALAASSLTTGSGKLLGRFESFLGPVGQNSTTFI
jgi:hypothetical protein